MKGVNGTEKRGIGNDVRLSNIQINVYVLELSFLDQTGPVET